MRKSLFLVVVALLFGPGAVAQEKLTLDITGHFQDIADRKGPDGQWLWSGMGDREGKRLELINIRKSSGPKNVSIEYRCAPRDSGETEWVKEGADCGTRGKSKSLLTFAVRLTGEGAKAYKLSYNCYSRGKGDSGVRNSPEVCGVNDVNNQLVNLLITVTGASEDQGFKDDTIFVQSFRLKLADRPKVAFLARVFGGLSSFYIAYQTADAAPNDQPKNTAVVRIYDGDTRRRTMSPTDDPYGYYGDAQGKKDELVSEALLPDTAYVYWLVGKRKDDPNKEYRSPKIAFKIAPLPGLKMGVLTGEASQASRPEKTLLTLDGGIGQAKDDGNAYIEYGTNPKNLDQKTKEKSFSKGDDVWYSADVNLVVPGATYYYRLAADYMDGDTAKGNTLSTKVRNVTIKTENPCEEVAPGDYPLVGAARLSEDLAIVCTRVAFESVCCKGSGQEGLLICPEQFPRNLNTNPFDFKIPKTDVGLSWEQAGVGFWRSSNNVRFNDYRVWATKGNEGQEQPLRRGSQPYNATNWDTKAQTMFVWIYCSSKWSAPNTFK
jgi:hypothetical protein